MIGQPQWFTRRKYGGWGIRPKTWQGWVYIAAILIPFVIFHAQADISDELRMKVTIGWLAFVILDTFHIMFTLKRDELEYKIEAISERNAAWTMMMILVLGLLYQTISSAQQQTFQVDPFLAGALFTGMIVKTISNLHYEKNPPR